MRRFRDILNTLRTIITGWLLFSLMWGNGGLQAVLSVPTAKAAGEFSVKTGYYVGTGTTLAITGLGFQPEVVMVKAESSAGNWMFKTSAMPTSVTAYLGASTSDNAESEITFTSDGFTLSPALEVNTVNVRFLYMAFYGYMCVGSYTGNGSSNQAISSVGFQPDLVMVRRSIASSVVFRTSDMSTNHAAFIDSASANNTTGVYFQTLNATGFTVGSTVNVNAGSYYFLAFKNLANKFKVGTFTGDGTDNRNITGVGFLPDFVFIKQNSAIVGAFLQTESWGDASVLPNLSFPVVNHIQSLLADGFQVGSGNSVNVVGVASYYFAFGGAPDPVTSGSFYMARGSYTGNGTSQSIDTTFRPDLVMIKGNTIQYAVWATSLERDNTHYFATTTPFTTGITSLNATSFSVGAHATVNSNLLTYEWMAFGNATTPQRGGGSAEFVIGAFTGTGLARSITNLGMAPDMVTVSRNGASTPVWKTSAPTTAAGTSLYFVNTADDATATLINTLTSNGFTVGTGATVNTANAVNVFFGFKEGANFDVGTYTGDGVAGRDVTGLGFDPDLVWVKRSTAVGGVLRSTSSTITGTNAQYFQNLANAGSLITGFITGGFEVGTASEVNAAAGVYRYAAWNATTTANPPNTPTNSSPANAATAQDLNPTLTGSAYSDTDGDTHAATYWEVDDDSNFTHPAWTRTSVTGETSIVVNTTNGTFANESAGKTELDHNTTYYWRVKYSDGVYSPLSTATSFTTNAIVTPTNSSPAADATVTSLTPTLTASAFSDPQAGHTSASAQWQISTVSDFSTTVYDSGTVSYTASLAVPSAVLADRTSYYWRVRYKDSSDFWSSWSTATRFATNVSVVSVTGLIGSPVVDQGDTLKIDARVALTNGTAINDATVTVNIYNPSGTKVVDAASMTYLTGSNGVYRYSYTVPATSGSYLYEATAVSNSVTGYGAGNFEVRTLQANVSTISSNLTSLSSTVSTIASDVADIKTDVATLITQIGTGNISAIKTATDTINWANVTTIVSNTGAIQAKTDTIDWTDVAAIKTKTDTIAWADITDIQSKVDTLVTQIGTGNISAIKTATDTIAWTDVTSILTDTGIIKAKTNTIDWTDVAAIKTKTDTILWTDVTGVRSVVDTLASEIGTGNISAIKTKTDTVDWTDVTGVVTDTGLIRAKTDTIDWSNVTAIKTKTDTINWADVTDIQSNADTLVTEIGTGRISAIKTSTDTIDWGDVTGIVTDTGLIKAKTDTIDWTNVTAIKTKTDTILWTDVTGVRSVVDDLATEIGTGNIAAIKTKTDTINWANVTGIVTDTGLIKAKTDTIDWTNVTAIKTKTDTIAWADVTDIQAKATSIQANMDILVGAMIVTQGTVSDASATTTSFVSSLTNATTNFYKNAVITFTSGALDGQNRRISAYDGVTKAITVDPALTSAPANGAGFTIITQNVRVEEQMVDHEALESAFRADVTNRLTSIETKIDTITSTLNGVDTDLSATQAVVDNLRASQVLNREVVLSDVSTVAASGDYHATLTVQDYESDPVAPDAAPQITIYDATGATVQAATPMTLASTGVYTFDLTLASDAVSGLWESKVTVDVGGSSDVTRKDYFYVTGAPAQVLINSISDLTVPSIAADITITNEGTAPFEYPYEWCVVSSVNNACGGGDDVYHGSAAKLIAVGENFNTTLSATVPTPGNYYFKLVAYFGTEASAASRSFTAVADGVPPEPPPTSGGGGSSWVYTPPVPEPTATGEDPTGDHAMLMRELSASSLKLEMILESLSMISPDVKQLLVVNAGQTSSLKDIQNKVSDLRAVSTATRQIVERKASEPIVHSYMKFNSVVISFLITNPTGVSQTLKFKAFLPEEAKPEYVMDSQGLKVDYDTDAKLYFVSGDVVLGPSETVTRDVELKDVWVFDKDELGQIKAQVASMLPVLSGTQYEAQGILLKNDVDSTIDAVLRKQESSYTSPQDHIVAYRENVDRVARVHEEVSKMKDLVVQAGASRSVVGQVGGIQTFATWGIIVAIVFGFGMLAAVIFAMWRHQTLLTAAALGMSKDDLADYLGKSKRKALPPAPKKPRIRRKKEEPEPIDLPPPPDAEPPPM